MSTDANSSTPSEPQIIDPAALGIRETLKTHLRGRGWGDLLDGLSSMLATLTFEGRVYAWAEHESPTCQMLRAGARTSPTWLSTLRWSPSS